MTEREMQELFINSSLINTFKGKNYYIFQEVEFPCRCDVVAYHHDDVVAFELKLNNVKKVIEQAQRNAVSGYDRSFIVVPEKKYSLIENKYMKLIETWNIGIVLYSETRKYPFYYKRKIKKKKISFDEWTKIKENSEYKRMRKKHLLHDKLIRGFYLDGVKERASYK